MQIILDCTSCKINQLIPYTNQELVQIERATQHYCFVLHQKRTEILKNIMQKGRQSIANSTFLELFFFSFFFWNLSNIYKSANSIFLSYCVQHPIRSLKKSFYILNCLHAYLNDEFTFYESICFNNGRIAVFGECMKERTLYKLRLRFYLLVLCVYTFLLI